MPGDDGSRQFVRARQQFAHAFDIAHRQRFADEGGRYLLPRQLVKPGHFKRDAVLFARAAQVIRITLAVFSKGEVRPDDESAHLITLEQYLLEKVLRGLVAALVKVERLGAKAVEETDSNLYG